MALPQIDLARFIGGRARLWDFSPSHDRLVVRLAPKYGNAMFLVLSGCEQLAIPVSWSVVSPRLVEAAPPFLELLDDQVRVRCQDVSLHPHDERCR